MKKSWNEHIKRSSDFLRRKIGNERPLVSVICGSGWAQAVKNLNEIESVGYSEIECLSQTTIEGHESTVGIIETPIGLALIFKGRRHAYEGVGWSAIKAPILLANELGCQKMVLTNAAGGINESYKVGDIMIIKDHINMMGSNPLIGELLHDNIPRFPDQTEVYCKTTRKEILGDITVSELNVKSGIYLAISGPAFETPAEIRAFKTLGADAVGMSTVPEAMIANAIGMKVCAVSLISNLAAGISDSPLSHAEVNESASKALPRMEIIIKKLLDIE